MQGLRVFAQPTVYSNDHALNKLKSLKGRVALLFAVIAQGGSWCAGGLAKCVRVRVQAGPPAGCVPSFSS